MFSSIEEFNILKDYTNILLGHDFIVQINYIDSSKQSLFKFEPEKPQVITKI